MLQGVRRYLPSFIAILCLATVAPGLFLSFEDSEIWGITSSRRIIDHPLIGSSAHYKPLFSLLFGTIAAVAKSDWSALVASRWLAISFAAGGLFSLYSVGLTFLRAERNRWLTVLTFAIVSTMPLLFLHFTKARSDTVSASLILIGAFLLCLSENRSTAFRGVIYVVTSGCALLMTPKSVDLALALAVVFWVTDFSHAQTTILIPSTPRSGTSTRLAWLFGPLVSVLLIALLISREFLVKSFTYWLDSYSGVQLFSPQIWISFRQSVTSAPIPAALLGIGMLAGLAGFTRLSMREKALVCVGWIVALFIAVHSQKYFFFLASRVPFLALGSLPGLHLLYDYFSQKSHARMQVLGAGLAAACLFSLALDLRRVSYFPTFRMAEQKAVYLALEQFLDQTKVTRYWDAIGLFPTRNQIFHYPSPGDRENEEMLNYVDGSRPTMILRTSKMELLEPNFMIWLQSRYVPINSQIYVRFKTLTPPKDCQYELAEITKIAAVEQFQLPLALVKRISADRPWVRVPFESLDGVALSVADSDTPSDTTVILDQCLKTGLEYAITEAGPWDVLPPPSFSRSFGYDGRL